MLRKPDPRTYQITVLASLLIYGLTWLNFELSVTRMAILVGGAQLTQWALTRAFGLQRFDPKSALISSLSLCLLLRTPSELLALSAVVITISSKFLIRHRGKHVFNPTNFGLVCMMLLSDGVWVSPGQWGSAAFLGFLLAGLGGLVIHRAARSDVTYAFIGFYLAILFGRAWWLGDPWSIPLHQLQNGAFLIFAFLMISDPKTTPDSRAGRILFAAAVAAVAGWIQFVMFRNNGMLWALACCAPLVPLVDACLRGPRYRWNQDQPQAQPGQPQALVAHVAARSLS